MDRRAAGALLALAACFACSAAAPTASNQTALDLYEGAKEGCYYNFQHYGEGDRIMTNEPCLNCTCHNRMLMCYLRVCPFTKAIGQDCTVEKRADQCCPIVTCPDVPVDLLTSTSTTSPAEYGATGIGKLDKYGCSISGKYFPEGSKVPPTPNKPCEHCYCIRNMTTCVMQECTLHVDGCTPIYHKDVCCPVRYSCDHPEDEVPLLDDMSTTVRPTPGFLLTTTTISPVTQMTQDCVHDDRVFSDGALIKTEKACEHCYCMKGDIVCVVQECGAPMENEGKNCSSLPPREGQCCPDTYICEGDELPSDLSTESTTESIIEKLTTLSPPRRTSVEGSGYRNEPDEAPYTDTPITEPEVEGSGDEEETSKPFRPVGTIPTPGDDDQYIYVTTQGPAYEEHEKTTEAIDKITIQDMKDKTVETPVSTNAPISEEEEKLTTSKTIEEDILEPHKDVSATMAPEIYESATTELGDLQNTVPDVIPDEEIAKPHGTTNAPTNEIVSLPPSEGEDDKLTTSQKEQDVTSSPTSKPEYSTTSSSTSDEIEKETATPAEISNITPEVMTEKEYSDSDITRTTSTTSPEESLAEGDKETSKPELLAPSATITPDAEEKESSKPEEFAPSTTSSQAEEEKESYKPEEFAPSSTSSPAEEEKESSKPEEFAPNTTSSPDEEEKESSKPEEFAPNTTSSPAEEEKESSKPEEFAPTTTSSPAEEEKESHKPEEFAPNTTSNPAEEEKESSKPEEFAPSSTNSPAEEESSKPEQPTPITTSSPLEKEETLTTEPDHAQNTVAVAEEDSTHPHSHIPTTTASPAVEEESTTVLNLEQDVVTDKVIKEDVPALTEHITTTAPAMKDTEFTTAEPDRGLNTIPSEIYEETSSEPSLPGRTTLSEETKGTEPSIITDEMQTQGIDIKPTSVSGLTTPLPEGIVTKGDQFTVTTEPSFRKEDEGVVSTEKIKEIEPTTVKSEFVDEGFIPTSSHGDKIGTSSDGPTTEEEFTTSVPEYITEIAETIGSKQTTTESPKETSIVTEILPEKVSEPSSEQDGDLPSSTEKLTEMTPLIETHEEPSRIPGEGDCLLNGVTYRNNTVVPSTNNCHTGCKCASSIIKCDPIICSPPPDYMDNCQSIYDSPDSCCPTFVCDHPRETVPPQSDNQMSGTESPMPSPTIECRGDQCEISEPAKQPIRPSGPCTSDSCLTVDDHKAQTECGSGGCGDISQKPDISVPSVEHTEECSDGKCKPESCANGECQLPQTQVSPVTACEGEHCEKTDKVVSESPQQCKNGEDCKSVEIPTVEATPCEGESCNKVDCGDGGCGLDVIASPPDHQLESCTEKDGCKPQDIPIPECTGDEPCRRKEVSTSDTKLPTTCEGINCISEKETTVAQGAADLSTELPKTEQTPSEEATEKIIPAEEEKATELPDDHISKPVDEKMPVKDTQETDTYTTEGQTAEAVTSAEIQKEEPVTEGEATKKPTTDEDKETEMPATVDDGDKEKPGLEEEITQKPTIIEKERTDTPDVIEEETTKPTMLGEEGEEKPTVDEEKGTEKPVLAEDKGTEEPTLVGDEGIVKPAVTEKEGTELPTIDSEEGTKKPAIIDEDDKEKPVVSEETTKEPTIVDEEGKEKPVIDEETTKEPAIVEEEGYEKPVVDEESTNEPAIIDEDGKETPVIDEETTNEPAIVDEEGKEKPVVDEESTKKPAIIDEDSKEKPVVTEEITKKPELVEEEGTAKPVFTEGEATTIPDSGEKATEVPAIKDQISTDIPAFADIDTDKPSLIDGDSKDKPVDIEKDSTDKPTITEDGTEKPVVVDEEGKPTDVDMKDTEKPGQEPIEELGSEKPAFTDKEGTDKPAVEVEATENPDVITEETTVVKDEDKQEKPGYGEDEVSEKPTDVEEKDTEEPAVVTEDSDKKPAMIDEDNKEKPDIIGEKGTEKPAVIDEQDTEKPITEEDDKKPAVFEQKDIEKPTAVDKESTEKPLVEQDDKKEPAVVEQESTEKTVTSDDSKPEKSPEIEEEHKDKPLVPEGSTVNPDVVDTDKNSERPDIDEGTEEPAIVDKDMEKPAVVDENDKEKPGVVEMESTSKPIDIEREGTELPVIVGEENTKTPDIIDEEGIKIPGTEEDTMKPFIIEEESTGAPDITEKEGTAKPVIIDEGTEEPTIIEKEDPMKPAGIEKEGTELPAVNGEEGTEKPVIIDEETEIKPDLSDQESTKTPAIVEEGTEEPGVPEEGTDEPSIFDIEGTDKPVLIDEEGKVKPVGEDGAKKPILVEEKPVADKEGEKPFIIDEEVTDKPADNEVLSTEEPKTHEIKEPGTEIPEAPHTSEPKDEVKSPEIIVQPTEATVTEIEKTTKTPYSESQATITEEVAHAYTTESNAAESMDVSTTPQETPEIKVTEAEDGYSKDPVTHDHSRTPEITTESLFEQEITTKTSVPDHEKVTISEQDIEVTTFKVDTTDVKEEGSTVGQDLISEEPALTTQVPESHKTSEFVEKTTVTESISEQEKVSTGTSDIESPTTKAPATGIIEHQEGIEPDKPELHVTSKSEDESTTKVYEEEKIKPIPESHVTETSSTSPSDGVTDVSEITDEHKPIPELPVHGTESDKKTTQVPLVEIKTDHPEIHSSEKEETITETPDYSVTEPVRRFTEIEDPSVTGQEEIATGYPEETTDHHVPSDTDKIDESGDVGITGTEKPLLTDMESELPEKSSESDKPVTKMPEQGYQTPEAEKEKPTDEFESPATEIPILVVTESQQTSDVPEKDVTSYEEKTTVIPDLSDHKDKATPPPEGYTEQQESGTEIPQHHVTTMEDANKATGSYVIEPHVTETQETSTKSVEQEVKDSQKITTDIPITSEKEGESETTAPELMHTESHDLDKEEPSITEIQKLSTDLPIEDGHTELPGVQTSSEIPQSLVTEQKESLGEQTTVSSIPKEKSTYKPDLLTTQSEEISKAPEQHVPGQGEIQTEAPVLVTESVDVSTKEPEHDDKITHVSEDTVTEKQDTATTLRESPAVTEEIEKIEVDKSTEHTSAQTEFSETTPYLIELEEHTHKIVEELTTVSPSEEEHSFKPVEDTSTSSPSEEEHSQKPIEDISTLSPSEEEEEHSYKPVEDISTSSPTKEEDLYKPIEDISTSSPSDEEHSHKPVDDISTSSPSEEEHSHKPVEDISTSSPPVNEYTPKIEEHVSTVSPLDEKPTTVLPEAGQEPQVSELTTKKIDEEIETATKETDSTTKSSEEPLPEDVSEKVSESIPVEETTQAVVQGEDTKYTADHKEYTTVAPTQITEESTPVLVTESEKLPTSESDIAVPIEKEISTSEKPSHSIVSHETTAPEEEFIFSTTKATTIRQEEDIVTPVPDDKFAKPEEKPSETSEVPPSSTTTEVSKPSIPDLQPTDEIPVPDEDGQLPPSGTSGYGEPEPDYVEEDQAFGPGTCRYGGKVYVSAQQIPRDDPCDFCFCFRSDIICLQQSCPPPIHGCHEEPIQGFCCPRYECPVSMATTVNVTTTTTTTTTTLPPHFPTHSYKGAAQRRGCQIKGHTYKVGEVVRSSSGPCLHCTCGGDGQMKCDPKACTPEPMLRQMIAAAVSAKRRR